MGLRVEACRPSGTFNYPKCPRSCSGGFFSQLIKTTPKVESLHSTIWVFWADWVKGVFGFFV